MRSVCNCGWYETMSQAQRQNQCVLWVDIKKIGVNESRTAVRECSRRKTLKDHSELIFQ